jgi:hypothetical protein
MQISVERVEVLLLTAAVVAMGGAVTASGILVALVRSVGGGLVCGLLVAGQPCSWRAAAMTTWSRSP